MDQYVKVTFPTRRKVRVDGKSAGFTNRPFQVATGVHTFHLGPKKNYKPSSRRPTVIGTTAPNPMVISFERIEEELSE